MPFTALRKSNEYRAHVAELLELKRVQRLKVERVIQAQRNRAFRHTG